MNYRNSGNRQGTPVNVHVNENSTLELKQTYNQALLLARQNVHDHRFKLAIRLFSGIIFMGTPHSSGSDKDTLVRYNQVLHSCTKTVAPKQTKRPSEYVRPLAILAMEFKNIADIPILSVYEDTADQDQQARRPKYFGRKAKTKNRSSDPPEKLGHKNKETTVEARPTHRSSTSHPRITSTLSTSGTRVAPYSGLPLHQRLTSNNGRTSLLDTRTANLPCFKVSQLPNPYFVGQNDILELMDKHLLPPVQPRGGFQDGDDRGHMRRFALCGMGGIGETDLAIKYAYTRREKFDAIFWLQAGGDLQLASDFGSVSTQLGLQMPEEAENLQANIEVARVWLNRPWNLDRRENDSWLLIFDNVEELETIGPYLPSNGNGAVLVTSRNPAAKDFQPLDGLGVDLEPLPETDAATLLCRLTQTPDSSSQSTLPPDERAASEELAAYLGSLPLAMTQMAGFIRRRRLSIREFMDLYAKDTRYTEIHDAGSPLQKQCYGNTLATAYNFKDLSRQTLALLRVMAFMNPDNIREDIFAGPSGPQQMQANSRESLRWTISDFEKARHEASTSSIIKRDMTKRTLQIHRIIQAEIRATMKDEEQRYWAFRDAVTLLAEFWPPGDHSSQKIVRWDLCGSLNGRIWNAFIIFTYLHERGFSHEGKQYLELGLSLCSRDGIVLEPLISDMHLCMGALCNETNDTEACLEHNIKCLNIRKEEAARGKPPDLRLAFAHSQMGIAYMMVRKFALATAYFQQSVDMLKSINVDPDEFGFPACNLGLAYWVQGEIDTTDDILTRLLAQREQLHGKLDRVIYKTGRVLQALGNVRASKAMRLEGEGKHEDARKFWEESFLIHQNCLTQYESTLGEFSHRTADALHKLAEHHIRRKEHVKAQRAILPNEEELQDLDTVDFDDLLADAFVHTGNHYLTLLLDGALFLAPISDTVYAPLSTGKGCAEAYRCCKLGGWYESVEVDVEFQSDDDTAKLAPVLQTFWQLVVQGIGRLGRSGRVVNDGLQVKSMETAGFVNIQDRSFMRTIGGWPADPKLSEWAVRKALKDKGAHVLHGTSEKMADIDVEHVLGRLSDEEKVSLLAGIDFWHTKALPAHGVPSLRLSDGPNGVRGTRFFNGVPAACLPCGTALGATFDTELLTAAGTLMAAEAKAKGAHVLLGPTINMQRSPLGGRGFESYSEDPVLAGLAAAAVVRGIQASGVVATIKHFVCNDQEHERNRVDALVTERALRELYLLPFQLAIRDGRPKALMTAYNKVNGEHVSESRRLLADVLRGEWGWKGLVMSDWFGTYSTTEAINAGLDLEMPGPSRWRGDAALLASSTFKLQPDALDERARAMLELVRDCHASGVPENAPEGTNDTPETTALLRRLAAESVVLLKNKEAVLPLSKEKKTLVIGPNAKTATFCGGGSASLLPYRAVSPLEGITAKVGAANVAYTVGAYAHKDLPDLGPQLTTTADGSKPGFTFVVSNDPFVDDDRTERTVIDSLAFASANMMFMDYNNARLAATWYAAIDGYLTADRTGDFVLGLCVYGTAQLFLDGRLLIDVTEHQTPGSSFFGCGTAEETATAPLVAGQTYHVHVRFGSASTSRLRRSGVSFGGGAIKLGGAWLMDATAEIVRAAGLAAEYDQVVVCVGLNQDWESEGFDRPDMRLPGHVDALVTAVTAANPRAVVVVQSGTPVEMPWRDQAAGLLQAWYGGNETGHGLADVLFGDVNPAAKLPLSFPDRVQHNPAYLHYRSEAGRVLYGEDIYMGYRYYDSLGLPLAFPFGFGLSYTTFALGPLSLYVRQHDPAIRRPTKELKAFRKVAVAAGQLVDVALDVSLKYACSYFDERRAQWICEAGRYTVYVSTSSRLDEGLFVETSFEVPTTFWWSGL
ncbi:beta-glucosidase [Grosmannia clavigera kw1407]|uniref:beta-glucosidase n=1 Tax=Grosmannia clavigera (strain kw1407 / UAMH 11150) TaxID=655863 RepID=F0XQH9_GROCL|nr:beta-glucosidase [Grosmannia clavigera kw1407]EFX00356.1 beta-glucosidase [Grosmannia clavigera kw1407]